MYTDFLDQGLGLIIGIVGLKNGEIMRKVDDLVVLPCPPFCPDGTHIYNPVTFSEAKIRFESA